MTVKKNQLAGMRATVVTGLVVIAVICFRNENTLAVGNVEAQRQDGVSQAVIDFLNDDILASLNPDKSKGQAITAVWILDTTSKKLEGKFKDAPLIEASIRNTLGTTYMSLGKLKAAEQNLLRALELRRDNLREENPDTLKSMSDVGVLYIRQGRYNEAEPLFVKSLEIRRRILGEEHPDTLKSMTLLGVLRRVQGRNNEAEQLSAKALEIQRRVLGEEHPDTLMTMHNLGWSYLLQKRYSEAEPLLIKSVEIQSRVLGEEYSETLWAMQGLGLLYSNQGRYKEAEPLLYRVLEIRRRVLGEEHQDTRLAMRHLEELHNNLQGRDNEAESKNIVMDAYKMRMQGKVDDANALLVQAIQKNPHNAAAYYELARTRLYMATGDPRKMGLDIIESQQAIENAIVNDPNNVIYPFFEGYVALFQAYISQTKENNDRLSEAFETALKLKPDCRQAMLYLVEIYATLPDDKGGDKSKAEQYAKKLEGMDKVYGAKARSVLLPADANRVDYWQNVQKVNEGNADVLEELGKSYLGINDVNNAALCFEKAVKINPEKTILFMDLGIYHTWAALRARDNNDLFQKEIALGDAAVIRYLDCKPILPMQAYALGVRYKYKAHSGHKEQADELIKKAKELDPYFSKATGAPSPDLFIAPDEISHEHRYLFRPIQ